MFPSKRVTAPHYEENSDIIFLAGDDLRDYVTCNLLLSAGDGEPTNGVEPSMVFTGTYIHPEFEFIILHYVTEGVEPVSLVRSLVGTHMFTTACYGITEVDYEASSGQLAVRFAHRDVDDGHTRGQ